MAPSQHPASPKQGCRSAKESEFMTRPRVIFEDEWLVGVHKPTAMFVHRTDGWDREQTPLLQHVRNMLGRRVHTIHRLDRATSGIVIMAKDSHVAMLLHQMFRDRQVSKTYKALVRGFAPADGTIEIALTGRNKTIVPRDSNEEPQPAPEKPCRTHFECEQAFELPFKSTRYETTRCSLVRVRPVTGRWHQIRRHMNRVQHPVIGDTTHGDNTQNRFFRLQFQLKRLMLAATQLQFKHPITATEIQIESPPDNDFQQIIQQILPFAVSSKNE